MDTTRTHDGAGALRAGAALVAALAVLLVVAAPRQAQAQDLVLPGVAAAYPDRDPAGAIYPDMDPEDPALEPSLNTAVRRSRNANPVPLAQRGLLYHLQGNRTRGQRDYDRAFAVGEPGTPELRYAHWSYGWALYAMGEYAGALEQWRTAADMHEGNPHWVPSTFALALWSLGARDAALPFFDAAARSQPELWSTAEAVEATTRDWRPNERLAMLSMHNQWQSRGSR